MSRFDASMAWFTIVLPHAVGNFKGNAMMISPRYLGRVLALLFLLGGVNPILARGWSKSLDVNEPSPLFTGKSIPEPPLQKAKWTPPTTTVPKEFVEAAALLFADGLADPRGCEYREIYVTFGTWGTGTGDGGVQLTHGWVLPSKEGENHRFAICWNGLAYPLVNIGAKADLQADVNISASIARPCLPARTFHFTRIRMVVFGKAPICAILRRLCCSDSVREKRPPSYGPQIIPLQKKESSRRKRAPRKINICGWQIHSRGTSSTVP